MKKDKIIENEEIISNFKILSSVNSKKSHPLVVEEVDEQYKIVKEFSEGAVSATKIASVEDETPDIVDETANYVYAEEIIEDDDDLYADELRDRELDKQRHRTYLDLAKEFDEKLEANGYHGQFGFDFLAAMRFSRLLYFKNRDSLDDEIKCIARTLDIPYIEIKAQNLENIGEYEDILELFINAKKNFHKPYFINVGELEVKKVFDFLRPVYNYIDNPDGDSFLTSNGRNIYIPHNIYFIYTIKDHKYYFDVSRRLLRYSAIVNAELVKVTPQAGQTKMVMSFDQLNAALSEADENFEISEECWRKIDNFVNAISEVNGYRLQNKIIRRLENYMIILLSADKKEEDALDICLSNNLMSEAIVAKDAKKYFEESPLLDIIDESFDGFAMTRSKEVVAAYLSLFDKKGERFTDDNE